jgi:hypothetical protein
MNAALGVRFLAGAFFAAVFFTAFLGAAFLATTFLAGAFFAAGFLAGAFLAGAFFATAFLAGAFFATAFFAAGFLTAVFLAAFFAVAIFIFLLEVSEMSLCFLFLSTPHIVRENGLFFTLFEAVLVWDVVFFWSLQLLLFLRRTPLCIWRGRCVFLKLFFI